MFFNKSKKLLQEKEIELSEALVKLNKYEADFKDVIEHDKLLDNRKEHLTQLEAKLNQLNDTYQKGLEVHKSLEAEIALYEDSLDISSYGLYKPRFSFDTSERFKQELESNYEKQKQAIKNEHAVVCNTEWSVGGSKVEGRKMTNQYKKLMLYAFNGECDSLISKVKWNNVAKAQERIMKAFDSINKLGVSQDVKITHQYLDLKLQELSLTHEYEQKKYEEKEEQRMIREQMREEERAQKELEKAQKEAEDEEQRFQKALEKAKKELNNTNLVDATVLTEQIKELEKKLQEAHEKKERAIAMAQLTKVGHIYVISNIGSFGDDVYKIGMTRRLDPLDRVRELGDASVPFQFDIHAIIYSENAPQLEYELHKKFSERRINKINHRKEFFKVSLDEIEAFVKQHANAEIEFTKLAEAREYRETLTLLKEVDKLIDEVNEETSAYPKSLI